MMRCHLPAMLVLALASAAPGAGAQVYRCASAGVYTDQPCEGASAVDVRPNIMDAGPRHMAGEPAPSGAPAIILPAPPKPAAPAGSLWDRRDAADAEHRNRTGPYRPSIIRSP